MRIHVGSTNPNKVGAVDDVLRHHPMFADAQIVGIDVPSGVSDQPSSLAETVQGATQRANACFAGADLSIGLEAGVMDVPGAGPMNVQVCAIWDGAQMHHGLSSAYGLPQKVMTLMENKSMTMGDAVHAVFGDGHGIGSKDAGLIGTLTNGRISRRDLCAQAVAMAMVSVGV